MNLRSKPLITVAAVAAIVIAAAALWQADASESIPIGEVSHIHGIAVDPTDPARLLLATHHGVYRTAPDGTAEQVSDDRSDYMGFTPHPSDPDVFYASGHPAGGGNLGFITSKDGGQSWEQIAQGANGPVDFHAMDVSAADPNVIYGLYGDIQISRDGGKTWEVAGAPQADVFDLGASATNPDIVYAATRDGLMVSGDGAETWMPAFDVQQPATMVQAAPDGTVYAFVVGTGLIRTKEEPGLIWETVSSDFGNRVLLHLAIDPSEPKRLFAVTQDGAILASTDGGRNWSGLGA
ncbi:F510_1955 family glycosylhydrolase [Inquilinus sp. CAU 1745]|uniref:F510_1955 family glycosylhydrolase n=1 Tax=Inquilinus sp. CAU 1745 TaxID=3140369 RepID=UPI00325B63B0